MPLHWHNIYNKVCYFILAAALGYFSFGNAAAATAIGFAQSNYATPQSSQSAVSVTYAQAQTAGNLNVVVVGWNDTSTAVASVTDTAGNVYTRAVGPAIVSGKLSQSIYYAANILGAPAGANVVTVNFSAPAAYADIRILEYSGLDTANPLDVTAAGAGVGATSTTAAVATTNAYDLLFAANTVTTSTTAASAGFTIRAITVPDGDLAADAVVTATGNYSASAALSSSGAWVMQMVAFRGAGATAGPTPPSGLTATPQSSSQIALAWTASTSSVGIAYYRLERCQGSGCTAFAEFAQSTVTTYTDGGRAPARVTAIGCARSMPTAT